MYLLQQGSMLTVAIAVLEENIQFSAHEGLFSKPRPYTYQVGSRHSPDTKNTKIYVLGAENCKIHRALKYLRQLISE